MTVDLQPFIARMATFVGESEARRTVAECLRATELGTVETPQEIMRLAECLMRRGGVPHLIGRLLRVRALESGAPLPS